MKKLIASLIIGLGAMHGAQADIQQQTFDITVPADSESYTFSKALDAFNTSLGTLTGIQVGYSLFSNIDYAITNNGKVSNQISLSADNGYMSLELIGNGLPSFSTFTPITGSTSFSLAPGESNIGTLTATAKDGWEQPVIQSAGYTTANVSLLLPSVGINAKRFSNLQVSAAASDLTGTAYVNYVYTAVAAPVPEPESYGMMLAGLGLIGAMVGRRRTK